MNYYNNGDTFKIKNEKGNCKLYYVSTSKWSTNLTYIGTYKTVEKAQTAARKYSN